jgi:LysR family nitrogen assimilation transcriptional regulator
MSYFGSMDLKQLEYFVRVAEVGSFTRAAIALDIAQPALSRQIRLLEVELHQNLLVRNGRGATPTEAGKLLLEHGRGILHQVSRAKEELGRVRGALAGRVAIGMPPSVARVLAVPLIREFRRTMPDATLSIMEGLSVSMHEGPADGRLDIALLYNATARAGIELTPLVDEPLFLVERQPPKRQAGQAPARDPARPGGLPAGDPEPAERDPHAGRNRTGGSGPAPERGAGDRRRGHHPGPDAGRRGLRHPDAHAVSTSAYPQAFVCRPITGPAMRTKLMSAMSSQRPATLTQKAILQLIQAMAPRLLVSA